MTEPTPRNRERPLHFEPLAETLAQFGYGQGRAAPEAHCRLAMERFFAHGDTAHWRKVIDALPEFEDCPFDFSRSAIVIGTPDGFEPSTRQRLFDALKQLCPWRKGPFEIGDIELDAEWRSDMKWARVKDAVANLEGQRVLDVGCGNGYYGLRALGEGATSVLGIDPSALFVLQFELLRRLLPPIPQVVLPLRFEELPSHPLGFDTVFSMGVLYHRKAPLQHLERLRDSVVPGGRLVLETLVVEDRFGPMLEPQSRYASMRNVWCIPSLAQLRHWLERTRFERVRVHDVTRTSILEQRATVWTNEHSLAQALDERDPTRTVEGYPAPLRALVTAEAD